jgi:cation diffusion facilitator family transporter
VARSRRCDRGDAAPAARGHDGGVSDAATAQNAPRSRIGLAFVSLAVAVVLLGVKFGAYALTGSQAILSDALESVVNVAAAAFALATLGYAGRPADRDHPFGHGKIEFLSAAFEGALVFAAAVAILWAATLAFADGVMPERLGLGLLLTAGAGIANGALGWILVRNGRRHRSIALEADGHHVLADFWTSVAVVVGLLLVEITQQWWLDPLIATGVGLLLLVTGGRLLRRAAGGLLDEEDPALLGEIVAKLAPRVRDGVISVHHLRAIRAGSLRHVSAHVVVPEFWTVERAHDAVEALADSLQRDLGGDAEIDFHTDPCERAWCSGCDLDACSVRQQPFTTRRSLTIDEAVAPDPRAHGRGSGSQ